MCSADCNYLGKDKDKAFILERKQLHLWRVRKNQSYRGLHGFLWQRRGKWKRGCHWKHGKQFWGVELWWASTRSQVWRWQHAFLFLILHLLPIVFLLKLKKHNLSPTVANDISVFSLALNGSKLHTKWRSVVNPQGSAQDEGCTQEYKVAGLRVLFKNTNIISHTCPPPPE